MTEAPWYWARATGRRRRRTTLLGMLLVAAACAVPMVAAAGARRTASVVDRASADFRIGDVQMQIEEPEEAQVDAAAALPGVDTLARHAIVFLRPTGTDLKPFLDFFAMASSDGVWGYEFVVPRIDAGRLPSPDAPNEVLVTRPLADRLDLEPGDTFSVDTLTMSTVFEFFETGGIPEPDGPVVEVTVTGVGLLAPELIAGDQIPHGTIVLSPAFLTAHPETAAFSNLFDVKLRDGAAGIPDFVDQATEIFGSRLLVTPIEQELDQLRAGVDVQHVALLLFLAVAGVAGVVAVVQAATRLAGRFAAQLATLEALGLSGRERVLAMMGVFAPTLVPGALIGAVAAALASTLVPFGIGRQLEPAPGLHVDWPVLAAGVALTVVIGVAAIVVATTVVDRRRHGRSGRRTASRVAVLASQLPPPVGVGTRWALVPGRGPTASPSRSALVGAIVAVAGAVGAAVFAASLARLLDTPSRYGINYDLEVAPTGDEAPDEEALPAVAALAEREELTAVTYVRVAQVSLAGESHDIFGIEILRGDAGYTVVEGREPASDTEVVVGTSLLRDLDLDVGEQLTLEGGSTALTIVGRALFPPLDDANSLATGVGFTRTGLAAARADVGDDFMSSGYAEALVTVAPELDVDVVAAQYRDEFGFVRAGARPTSVANLGEASSVPAMLGAFLAALGVLAVAHAITVAASRRRYDLAILGCLGFQRRQLGGTATTHTFAMVAVGVVVGLPLGILLGSYAWREVASGVGVATDAAGVATSIGWVLAGSAVVGSIIAIPWAVSAVRTRLGRTLRSE